MRLPDRNFAARFAWLTALAALAGCGAGGARPAREAPVAGPVNGPAADYPMTIGEPYAVGGVTYTPADVWNYDEVGYAELDGEGGDAVSASHHTLPLPSYVEVTSLDTGRTILVRVERRGPMDGPALIGLSPGAARQLGAGPDTPVRVRRVNPPEPERAALRAGHPASDRMDTPMSLVGVLKRKLPAAGAPSASIAPVRPAPPAQPMQTETPPPSAAAVPAPEPTSTPAPKLAPKPAPPPRPSAVQGKGYVVQAGAFSSQERADRVARAIGGSVSKGGSFYRVRTGPFATQREAEASLAKVKAAGYSDARIFPGG